MGDTRPGFVLWCSLGLLFGSGACYCVYKWIFHKQKCKEKAGEEKGIAAAISGTRVTGSERSPADHLTKSTSDNLEPYHLQKLIRLLETTEYCSVREQVLITLSNSATFSVNQDVIRELGGLSVIGKALSDPSTEVKVKALNALNNLSMNSKNQEHIQVYIPEICSGVTLSLLNSDLQLAGLRLLTNMSVTNDYQQMISHTIPSLFHILSAGNKTTQIQVLKILVNLSANPAMTRGLLEAQAPSSLISLFDNCTNTDVLLRALTFIANLSDNWKGQACSADICQFSADSVFNLFFRESEYAQRVAALLYHPDMEVKGQVARIMTS